jgi:hypothetical protein
MQAIRGAGKDGIHWPMSEPPPSDDGRLKDGRSADGRFTAGHRFSRGKLPGERNRATLMAERLLSKDVTAAMRKIGAAVRAGEPWALKFIGERFVPLVSRQTFIEPVDYRAPTTPEEARAMILVLGERVARGELSIEAHAVLLDNLKAYLGDRAAEQQRMLDDLENAVRNGETR